MKLRIVFALLFMGLIIGLVLLIPNNPSMAYPPPTPLPPEYVGPIWFGIYCEYPLAPPDKGYIRVKWDEGFPEGYIINPENPGQITVFYPPNYYQHITLTIIEDDVSHLWANLWTPINDATAQIYGYVVLRLPNGADYGYFHITPTYVYKTCPEPPPIYLPFIRK